MKRFDWLYGIRNRMDWRSWKRGPQSMRRRSDLQPAAQIDVLEPRIMLAADLTFEAESDLFHQIGRLDADGWSAGTNQDAPGFLNFGPYTTDVPAGARTASFRLLVDNNTADNFAVVKLDVVDATAGQVLTERTVTRQEFDAALTYQDFALDFTSEAGHQLEFRTFWFDTSYVRQDSVTVTEDPDPAPTPNVFEAETDLFHQIGRLDADGWSANTPQDAAGFLSFGPYTTDVSAGPHTANFRLLVDNNTADNTQVVKLDVVDVTAGQVLVQRTVTRQEFTTALTYQNFALDFINEAGHQLEFRTFWFDTSYVRQDSVTVTGPLVFQAETDLSHQIGRTDADGWSANTPQDAPGFLSFGPYTSDVPAGARTASFRLLVDNNTADNSQVVKLDVVDATAGEVLAQRTVTRKEFTATFTYQDFVLDFINEAGHQLEFRTFWFDTSYVLQDSVTVAGPLVYQAQTDLSHQIGRLDADGWSAGTNQDAPGFLSFGPYTTAVAPGSRTATFRLMVDNNTADNSQVVKLDVIDATAGEVIAQRTVTRQEFDAALTYQDFVLHFTHEAGHQLEFRTFWFDTSYVRQNRVTVAGPLVFQAETDLLHQVGRLDADGWSADINQDAAGFLSFGPYTTDVSAGLHTASFRLLVDDNTADNTEIVKLDVVDATAGIVLAQRTVTRQEFDAALTYQDFDLDFINEAGHRLEFRTQWLRNSYVRQDRVTVGKTVIDIGLGGGASIPGQKLAIVGQNFNPNAETEVVFTDGHGNQLKVPVASVAHNFIEVTVPPIVDPQTFDLGSGTVGVSVVQKMDGERVNSTTVEGFQIGNLPQTGVSRGQVTIVVLNRMVNLYTTAEQNYQMFQDHSSGTLNAQPLINLLTQERQYYENLRDQVTKLAQGRIPRIVFGQVNGNDVSVDVTSLVLLDRLLASTLFEGVFPSGNSPASGLLEPVSAQPLAGGNLLQAVEDKFTEFLTSNDCGDGSANDCITEIASSTGAFLGGVGIGLGVATIFLGLPAAAATSVGLGLLTGAIFLGTTAAVLLTGSSHFVDQNLNDPNGALLADQAFDQVLSLPVIEGSKFLAGQFVNKIGAALGASPLAIDGANLANGIVGAYQSLTTNEIKPNIVTLFNGLQPGVIVTPTSGLFTHEDQAQPPALFTIRLNRRPTDDVTILLVSSDTSEGTILSANPVFTPNNWNQNQQILVKGVDENEDDNNQPYTIFTSGAISSDPLYNGLDVPDVSITNIDDDEPLVPPGNVKGIWRGPAQLCNPLPSCQNFTMTVNVGFHVPEFTTVITGTVSDGSSVRDFTGTVSQTTNRLVINVRLGGLFLRWQMVGTVTPTRMRGDITVIDLAGGRTTGPFDLARITGPNAPGRKMVASPDTATVATTEPELFAAQRSPSAGLNGDPLHQLNQEEFDPANLPGTHLGLATGNVFDIDRNAPDYSRIVGATTSLDEEFSINLDSHVLSATERSPAANSIGLLTMGHLLEREDVDPDHDPFDVMAGPLQPGTRRLRSANTIDAQFVGHALDDLLETLDSY